MLIMAVSGAAVLALVCWAALRETAPRHFIPQTASEGHVGHPGDDDAGTTPPRPLAGTVTPEPEALHNTFADADTDEALAAAAALWNVMTQERQKS
jgi:hypothetical protein